MWADFADTGRRYFEEVNDVIINLERNSAAVTSQLSPVIVSKYGNKSLKRSKFSIPQSTFTTWKPSKRDWKSYFYRNPRCNQCVPFATTEEKTKDGADCATYGAKTGESAAPASGMFVQGPTLAALEIRVVRLSETTKSSAGQPKFMLWLSGGQP